MDSDLPEIISCDRLIEITVDARDCTPSKPTFAPVPRPSSRTNGTLPFTPPSKKAARAARAFWLKMIERFAEPEGADGRLRVRGAEEPAQGRFIIEVGAAIPRAIRSGLALDVSDDLFLVLFDKDSHKNGNGRGQKDREKSQPIPWTEVFDVSFEIQHLPAAKRPGTRGKPKN